MRQMLGWANPQPWFWSWVVVGLVNPPAFCRHHYLGELSSIALGQLLMYPVAKSRASCPALRAQIWVTHTHTLPGQLYCFAHARCRAFSPDCCREHTRGCVWGQLCCSQALRVGSHESLITGSVLVCPGEWRQG